MANNPDNIIPNSERTPEERRKIAQAGGIASGKARREKILLSKIYGEYLAKEHDVSINGESKKITGEKLLYQVISKILARGDSPSVSMMREMREATEGNKFYAKVDSYEMTKEERQARIAELEAKRNADRD